MSTDAPVSCARDKIASGFVEQLQLPVAYPHPVRQVSFLETHISYIFLTGQFAYKVKKAVNLGFLDFTKLEQRRHFCQEELRLNRRLAPSLYLDVVPIAQSANGLRVGGAGPAIEYAVKMLQFPQSSRLDCGLSEGRLSPVQVDAIADRIAAFHAQIPRTTMLDEYGTARAIGETIDGNLKRLRSLLEGLGPFNEPDSSFLAQLAGWCHKEYARLKPVLAARKRDGYVRECHGDLHLGNIAWWRNAPQIFDGIEFSPALRWIDVINEVAFTSMDFKVHERYDYAYRLLNRYLEKTGDYAGLELLAFYEVDRAIVRAMVACIRSTQAAARDRPESAATCQRYLAVAKRASEPRRRMLLLMHGLSGSGKTRASQAILECLGAIRIRSDIERKRLHCRASGTAARESFEQGIYDRATTRATYLHLVQLARQLLDADFPVVVDAANLQAWQREIFRSQARAQGVPFLILSCQASEETLFKRLQAREARGDDASDAGPLVLRHQLATYEPLTSAEKQESLLIEAGEGALAEVICRLKTEW
jgi:aminoglycoside phosphotransferase family enzyme/predicted kinase